MSTFDQGGSDVPFAVPFVHRLRFTHDVLQQDEHVLVDLLQPVEGRSAQVQFWLDESVAEARPDLRQRINAFTRHHAQQICQVGNLQIVPGGEQIKNDIHILERILKVLNAANLDRRSYVVAIGGGAVLDAVGFAVSIAHRGLRLVRLPTTTLAQADSGVGVKNGVNLFGKKNWLGAFAVPWAVVNDERLLETLSDRDFRCGFSEVVKVSLLKDQTLFNSLCACAKRVRDRDSSATELIHESAVWHLRHITLGGDPFEFLEARPLDFGHWSAHKLEPMSNFELRHGEAVAIGVAIDTVYSSLVHGFPKDDAHRVIQCLRDLGFQLSHPAVRDIDTLFEGLEEFRQHLGGRLTLTMLEGIGQPIDIHRIDYAAMRAAIESLFGAVESGSRPIRGGE